MKWAKVSVLDLRSSCLKISWTVQKDTWLNLLMKATILGAISLLFFLFHLQLLNSSGWIAQNTGKSSRVSCR